MRTENLNGADFRCTKLKNAYGQISAVGAYMQNVRLVVQRTNRFFEIAFGPIASARTETKMHITNVYNHARTTSVLYASGGLLAGGSA